MTADNILTYNYVDSKLKLVNEAINLFGRVPMIGVLEQSKSKRDFESVIPLIDAYNILQLM